MVICCVCLRYGWIYCFICFRLVFIISLRGLGLLWAGVLLVFSVWVGSYCCWFCCFDFRLFVCYFVWGIGWFVLLIGLLRALFGLVVRLVCGCLLVNSVV